VKQNGQIRVENNEKEKQRGKDRQHSKESRGKKNEQEIKRRNVWD
jgi:hypothetical protein